MTTYENPYGLGFEKATEEGPDVEIQLYSGEWLKRTYNSPLLLDNFTYRRPIKLQVGHRYVRRDGAVVMVGEHEPDAHYCMRYLCGDGKARDENGRYTGTKDHSLDLVTHIEEPETKDEQMKDTVTVKLNDKNISSIKGGCIDWAVELTYAEIEAAHAEMMRQKLDFKDGDIVRHKESHFVFVYRETIGSYHKNNLEKVTGTPEFMAQLRAILEGK